MAQIINNGIQALTLISLREVNPTTPAFERNLVLPSPESATFSTGITEEIIKSYNEIGERSVADTYVTDREGTLSLTFKAKTKELISAFFGLRLANGTQTTAFAKTIQVIATSYPAIAVGFDGNGMLADQADSYASYLTTDGISVQLTRTSFAAHNVLTDNTWAQGADGALRFSNNLVTAKSWVTIYAPYASTNTDFLSETPMTSFNGNLFGVLINKQRFHMKVPNLLLDLTENSEFDFGGGELNLNFRVGVSGVGCQTFELLFPNRLLAC